MKLCIILTKCFLLGLASATAPLPISNRFSLSAKKIASISRGGGRNGFRELIKHQVTNVRAGSSDISRASSEASDEASTEAFIGNLQLLTAGVVVWWATRSIPRYYVKQNSFLSKFNDNCGGADIKSFVNSIWPDTISRSLSLQHELTGVLVGALFTMSSLFIMNGRMGMPAIFPTNASAPVAIFHFFRWLAPFVSLFLIPKVPIFFEDPTEGAAGKMYETHVHSKLSVPGFIVSPALEIIQACFSLRKYFSTESRGEKLVPDESTDEKSKTMVRLHRAMWLGFMSIKLVLSTYTLYSTFRFIQSQNPKIKPFIPLGGVKGFIFESRLVMSLGATFIFLALAQFCECARGDMASYSWLYMIPFTLLSAKVLKETLAFSFMSMDIDKNYLEILGLKTLIPIAMECQYSSGTNLAECCADAYNNNM